MTNPATEFRDPPNPPLWVLDVVAAVAVIGLSFVTSPFHDYAAPTPWTIGIACLSAGLLPLRRRWPIPLLLVITALFIAVSLIGQTISPGIEVAVAIALFGVGMRTGLVPMIACTALVIVAAGASILPLTGTLFDPRVPQLVLTFLFAGAAGDATRMHRSYIASIKKRAVRAEKTREAEAQRRVTEERLRIARDLHDAVAHEIAVINLNAGLASQTIANHPEQAQQALGTVRSAARTVLSEIGDLLEMLRTAEVPEGQARPDVHPPQPNLDRLDALVARFHQGGLEVSVRVEGDLSRIPTSVGRATYRIVQEALTNAYKHGSGNRAHVLLSVHSDRFEVVITNPAHGPDRGRTSDRVAPVSLEGRGFGIVGMTEQAASVRGRLETGLGTGGWRVKATLPIPLQEAGPAEPHEISASARVLSASPKGTDQ